MDVQKRRRAIIVGGGRVGRRTAAQISNAGYVVTIIERNEQKTGQIPSHLVSRVLVGDGTDIDVFQQADPTMADAVAGLTNDTDTNLAVCELANEIVPESRTLARISKDGEQEYAHLDHVDTVVYPAAAGASAAATDLTVGNASNSSSSQ